MTVERNKNYYTKIVRKYKRIAKELDVEISKTAESLIDNLAFMECELAKVKAQVLEDGWVESYMNGANQFGKKESSAGKAYNNLIKSYLATWKQFKDLFPRARQKELDDGFDTF